MCRLCTLLTNWLLNLYVVQRLIPILGCSSGLFDFDARVTLPIWGALLFFDTVIFILTFSRAYRACTDFSLHSFRDVVVDASTQIAQRAPGSLRFSSEMASSTILLCYVSHHPWYFGLFRSVTWLWVGLLSAYRRKHTIPDRSTTWTRSASDYVHACHARYVQRRWQSNHAQSTKCSEGERNIFGKVIHREERAPIHSSRNVSFALKVRIVLAMAPNSNSFRIGVKYIQR